MVAVGGTWEGAGGGAKAFRSAKEKPGRHVGMSQNKNKQQNRNRRMVFRNKYHRSAHAEVSREKRRSEERRTENAMWYNITYNNRCI